MVGRWWEDQPAQLSITDLGVTSMKCESRTCASHVTLPEELDLWLTVFGRL